MKEADRRIAVKPPDGGYGWVVVLSGFLVSFLVFGICYSIGVLFDVLKLDFDCSNAELTTFASIAYSLQCFFAPVASYINHRFSARVSVIAGTVIFFFSMVSTAFSPTVGALNFTFGILAGIGMGLIFLPTRAMIPTYFEKKRSVANALCSMGGYLGAFVFPIVIRYSSTVYSWRGALFLMGAVQLNAIPAALLLLPVEQMVRVKAHREVPNLVEKDTLKNWNLSGDVAEKEPNIDGKGEGCTKVGLGIEEIKGRFVPPAIPEESPIGKIRAQTSAAYTRSVMELRNSVAKREFLRQNSDPAYTYMSYHSGKTGHLRSLENLQGNLITLYGASKLAGSLRRMRHLHLTPADAETEGENKNDTKSEEPPKKWTSAVVAFFWRYFKHFRNPKFTFFFIGNSVKGFVFYTPTLFIVNYGVSLGLPAEQLTMLMSMIGFGAFAGRPVAAFFGDLFSGHRTVVYALQIGFAGAVTLLVPWITNIYFLTFFVTQFSFMTGGADVLVAPITADIAPLDELVFALGVILCSEGFAYFVGPLVLALLPSFPVIFTTVGAVMLLDFGILLLPDTWKCISQLTTGRLNSKSLPEKELAVMA